jgi:mannose-6-phosphate isomerase-like protein (cupin superfamily)
MIKFADTINTKEYIQCCDGDGITYVKDLLVQNELYNKVKLIASATLNVGDSIGFHMHYNEMEIYIITSGNGIFNDNGTEYKVHKGDICITLHSEGHALKPDGDIIEFIAEIISF